MTMQTRSCPLPAHETGRILLMCFLLLAGCAHAPKAAEDAPYDEFEFMPVEYWESLEKERSSADACFVVPPGQVSWQQLGEYEVQIPVGFTQDQTEPSAFVRDDADTAIIIIRIGKSYGVSGLHVRDAKEQREPMCSLQLLGERVAVVPSTWVMDDGSKQYLAEITSILPERFGVWGGVAAGSPQERAKLLWVFATTRKR